MPITEKQQWTTTVEQPVSIEVGGVLLRGDLIVPEESLGLVLFAAGDGMSRSSSQSRRIVRQFEEQGLSVLLVDLLTADEEKEDRGGGRSLGEVPLLSSRLLGVAEWVGRQAELRELPIGIFGQGTLAAAALAAAAERPRLLGAVVCRGGRVDLAGSALGNVSAPVLLLVGGDDAKLTDVNESALLRLGSRRREMVLIPGASAQFDELGDVGVVSDLAADWFSQCLIELW